MDEPAAKHNITGHTARENDEIVVDYEIPKSSTDGLNEYMELSALTDQTITSLSTVREKPTTNVDVSKPENYATALVKVQIFCIILLSMLVISSVTIGVLIHTLMQRTNETEMKSDELQLKIRELQNRPGFFTETDSANIEELQGKVIQLEKDRSFHTSMIQDHGSRITQLETDVAAAENNIRSQDARINNFESDSTTDPALNNNINITLVQIAANISANKENMEIQKTRLNKIETDIGLNQGHIQTLNDTMLTFQSGMVLDIKNSQFIVEFLNSSVSTLETNLTMQSITIQNQSLRLGNLESKIEQDVTVKDLNSSLLQLKNDTISLGAAVTNNSLNINQIYADLEKGQNHLDSLSSRVAVNENNIQLDNSTTEDYQQRLSSLEQKNNHTVSNYQNMDSRLNYLEDELNCSWGNWTMFSSCTATCSDGIQYRERSLEGIDDGNSRQWCARKEVDIETCNIRPCDPVNGGWGQWTNFSECSHSCGGGTQKRNRACDDPKPAYGGFTCPGDNEETKTCNTDPCPEPAPDCSELHGTGRHSGAYTIYPYGPSGSSVGVFCEYSTDGDWTVIQRRIDGSVDFYRNWTQYKEGFGNASGEYWIGNEALHQITIQGNYSLKVQMTNWDGVTKYTVYNFIRIGNESDGYRLNVNTRGISGNAGDSLGTNKGKKFTTKDVDNDEARDQNCAVLWQGAWWYGSCGNVNLNGRYISSANTDDPTRIRWLDFSYTSLKATKIMIKKN